jgi:hypothetical protein
LIVIVAVVADVELVASVIKKTPRGNQTISPYLEYSLKGFFIPASTFIFLLKHIILSTLLRSFSDSKATKVKLMVLRTADEPLRVLLPAVATTYIYLKGSSLKFNTVILMKCSLIRISSKAFKNFVSCKYSFAIIVLLN